MAVQWRTINAAAGGQHAIFDCFSDWDAVRHVACSGTSHVAVPVARHGRTSPDNDRPATRHAGPFDGHE